MTSSRPPILCIDIGGTSTKSGFLAAASEIRPGASILSKPDVQSYFDGLVTLIERNQAEASAQCGQPAYQLGVAIAGFLDPGRTYLLYNSNLSWLENFPLKQQLSKRFPELSIELEVDSNAATMAEYQFGSGLGYERFLCVTSGTGLGVGMTVNGQPLRFAYGCMGDIGHVIVQRDGPLCSCGGRGCAEILVSATEVASRYREAAGLLEKVTLRDTINAAHAGNEIAVHVLHAAGEWLGIAIASMANILFPDHIALAGGLSAAGDFVLRPAQTTFSESACIMARSRATLTKASLGPLAPLIGAACPFLDIEQTSRSKQELQSEL